MSEMPEKYFKEFYFVLLYFDISRNKLKLSFAIDL